MRDDWDYRGFNRMVSQNDLTFFKNGLKKNNLLFGLILLELSTVMFITCFFELTRTNSKLNRIILNKVDILLKI